jgi:2,4-dienoyl-CoA reductase-like NADH-dependent reductase (Old Yellow Enzyme family)
LKLTLRFKNRNAIRARVPDKSFILCIKLNSVEFQSGGFTPEDCKALCVDLEEHGFDFVELSGGTYEANAFQHRPDARESTKQREAFL